MSCDLVSLFSSLSSAYLAPHQTVSLLHPRFTFLPLHVFSSLLEPLFSFYYPSSQPNGTYVSVVPCSIHLLFFFPSVRLLSYVWFSCVPAALYSHPISLSIPVCPSSYISSHVVSASIVLHVLIHSFFDVPNCQTKVRACVVPITPFSLPYHLFLAALSPQWLIAVPYPFVAFPCSSFPLPSLNSDLNLPNEIVQFGYLVTCTLTIFAICVSPCY